jgi:hypothetical protein
LKLVSDANVDDADQRSIPVGYRQGVITAISVTLGFSLYFLRFWNFEAPGEWTLLATAAAGLVGVAIVVQLIALWRSLQVEDDREGVYRVTLKWYFAGILIAVAGVVLATISYL